MNPPRLKERYASWSVVVLVAAGEAAWRGLLGPNPRAFRGRCECAPKETLKVIFW